jgi:hypothetical protein
MKQRVTALALAVAAAILVTGSSGSFAQMSPPGTTGDQGQTGPQTGQGGGSGSGHHGHHHHQQDQPQGQPQSQ